MSLKKSTPPCLSRDVPEDLCHALRLPWALLGQTLNAAWCGRSLTETEKRSNNCMDLFLASHPIKLFCMRKRTFLHKRLIQFLFWILILGPNCTSSLLHINHFAKVQSGQVFSLETVGITHQGLNVNTVHYWQQSFWLNMMSLPFQLVCQSIPSWRDRESDMSTW